MSITENSTAMKILDLDQSGKIQESSHKKEFQVVFYPTIINGLKEDGLGYKIEENAEMWKVYEDKGYQIIVGTVAKNENELFMFTIVYRKVENNWEIVNFQIGNENKGNYPKDILPN
jgi:hypothetical protein